MTATAGQQREHPGVIAMRAHVEQLVDNLQYYERCAEPDESEKRLECEIASLQAKLDEMRHVRISRASRAQAKRAELEQARKTLAECEKRPAVAQLMWCKLLMERSKKS